MFYYFVFNITNEENKNELVEILASHSSSNPAPTATTILEVRKKYPKSALTYSRVLTKEDYDLLVKYHDEYTDLS